MELWDAYTRNGVKTGGVLYRGQRMWPGIYHLTCEVLVRHIDGTYLCMTRSRQKRHFPLYPDCTAGGSALLGEDPLACIRRELREETGIVWEEFEEINRTVRETHFAICHSYVCTVDWPKDQITPQAGETEAYQWLTEAEFVELVHSGRMIPGQPQRMENWLRKMGYLA